MGEMSETEPKRGRGDGPNITGIPEGMKERAEAQSGFSFEDVHVHFNSEQPAQFQALAFTRGNQVYIGPGHERYLGHELGHVVQQKQGRVAATGTVKGQALNDSKSLEQEADRFGRSI